MKPPADGGKSRGDRNGRQEGSAAEIEAGPGIHVRAVQGDPYNMQPEDGENAPMTDGPGRFVQRISLRQGG